MIASSDTERDAEWDRAEAEIVILNDGYMKGDLEGARQNLLKAERSWIKCTKIFASRGQTLNYDRLYALERAAGNTDMTDIYLVKAKYWLVVDMELRHFSSEQIAAHLRRLTPDGVVNGILHWDRKAFTEGKVPAIPEKHQEAAGSTSVVTSPRSYTCKALFGIGTPHRMLGSQKYCRTLSNLR